MSDRAPLILGSIVSLTGDVTQNRWVGARSASQLERNLGFAPGRLSHGWTVLLLKQTLTLADFKFSGLTLRSGGRLGLPAETTVADEARKHVHDEMLKEYGTSTYEAMQRNALAVITPTGDGRIVKVIPKIDHSTTMKPSDQYPMGGGGLQWTLTKPCAFLVAMTVDRNGIATAASTSPLGGFLGESAPYENRAKLAKFLDNA